MGKRVRRRGIPGLAVALGVIALVVLPLWGEGGRGLALGTNNIFVPLVMQGYPPPPPVSLEDHFDNNADNWTPFTNYRRLHSEQWYWGAGGGHQGGGYRHDMCLGVLDCQRGAHDALTMYLQGNSQEWTDYRFQARVNLVDGHKIGLWFRLTYEDIGASGKKLTGYYFNMTGGKLQLWQMQTEDEYIPGELAWIYHFAAPILLTEVSYSSQARVWYTLKVEVEGSLIKCYVDDVLKIEYDDTVGTTFLEGTVGLFVYKAEDARFDDILVEPL